MRTTIHMNDGLKRQADELAQAEGRTFTSLVEEAVARLLHDRQHPRKRRRIVLPTFRGGKPLMNLDKTSDVLDALDREDYAPPRR